MLSLKKNEAKPQEEPTEAKTAVGSSRLRQGPLSKSAQGDEEAEVEPWFPDLDFAKGVNEQVLQQAGQGNHALLRPDVLDGALGRARNYWAYTEDPAQSAAALAHGVGQAQAFEDGNKRTAYYLTHAFLHNNGYGHTAPDDDEELADHLIGYGEGTHTMDHTADMLRRRMGTFSNVLDPVQDSLDPSVWDEPESPQPVLKPPHKRYITSTIFKTLADNGYEGAERWCRLVLTGSLTTYQYSSESDCDVSLFIDSEQLPEWSRAEMIAIMVSNVDGNKLPGTTHVLQDFVVSRQFKVEDLYKPGMRSGYDLASDTWIVSPEHSRTHDVSSEWHASYTLALETADKMARLLEYEPERAAMMWHQLHHRRQRDMIKGHGDYADSNLQYKALENHGLFPAIAEATGEHIA